jgi:hypothetical protein
MKLPGFMAAAAAAALVTAPAWAQENHHPLWDLYEGTFKPAKYVDLTHAFAPVQPVWLASDRRSSCRRGGRRPWRLCQEGR